MLIQAYLWMLVNALGACAGLYNLYRLWQSYLKLTAQGRNGKEKSTLWQQSKNESSISLIHIAIGSAPLIDTASPEFILFCFISFTYLAYVSFSRWQFNELFQALIRETTNPHKIPSVLATIETLQDRIKELESELKISGPISQRQKLTVVGIWAQNRKKSALALQEDFATFLNSGGSWNYKPIIERVTTDNVENYFNDIDGPIDLVYYAGHSSENGLFFEDQIISPRWFSDLLILNKARFVILASCRGRNIAKALSRAGITVVFMQENISDNRAIKATGVLLGALSDGKTLDYAVKRARLRVKEIHQVDYFGEKDFRLNEPVAVEHSL